MQASEDELASYYGKLAESIEVADDYSSVAYTLREDAYWHDGEPVTVDDVLWTFKMLKTEAGASWRMRYEPFESVERTGPRSFRFRFSDSAEKNPQLVILSAAFTPLPEHYWENREFSATTLEPPLGNGPYRISEVDPGHKLVFERVEDYWGRDLNVNVGQHNFDRIAVHYFFDMNVMLQALRAGVFDYYRDQNEATFHTAYDFAGYHQGLFKKETYVMGNSYGMHWCIVLNNRREAVRGHTCSGSPDLGLQLRVGESRVLAWRPGPQQQLFHALGDAGGRGCRRRRNSSS